MDERKKISLVFSANSHSHSIHSLNSKYTQAMHIAETQITSLENKLKESYRQLLFYKENWAITNPIPRRSHSSPPAAPVIDKKINDGDLTFICVLWQTWQKYQWQSDDLLNIIVRDLKCFLVRNGYRNGLATCSSNLMMQALSCWMLMIFEHLGIISLLYLSFLPHADTILHAI